MFKNPGEKLKLFAVVTFFVNCIAFIILAFIFGIDRSWSYYTGDHTEITIAFPLILFGGIAVSYVECLAIYAFGELVGDVHDMKMKTFGMELVESGVSSVQNVEDELPEL